VTSCATVQRFTLIATATGYSFHGFRFASRLLVIGKWHFTFGIHFSDEVESLKLEYRFVKAVLYSSFIHQEAVDDPCICEILYGQSAKSQMVSGGGRPGLRLVLVIEKQGFGEFCQWGAGFICVQCVYGLVLDSTDSF
jgi:hypothetical protein